MDVFRSHFSAFQDQYVLIGGMACDLLLNEAGERFRPTKDVDMVLIIEALTTEFAEAFWAFVEAGGYGTCRWLYGMQSLVNRARFHETSS